MDLPHSRLEVHTPDGRTFEVDLAPGPVQVGRSAPGHLPDVVLEPDPQRWVGRLHCVLDYAGGAWWLSDNGTVNGTFLRRGEHTERVLGRVRLRHQDVIRILGGMAEDGALRYWDLALHDPYATRQAPRPPASPAAGLPAAGLPAADPAAADPAAGAPASGGAEAAQAAECLEYDWVQARLYGRRGGQRREIAGLSPLAHRLVRHMADRSRANGGVPVACPHEELIRAVWGDGETAPHGFTAEHLRDLVSDLRKRLEPDRPRGEASRLLQTVPGFGYRLMVCAGEGQ